MELPFSFSLDDSHFKDWECMHSELEQEVHLKFSPFFLRPVRIIFIDFGALTTATNYWGEPILLSEEDVGDNGSEGIETGVETEFEYVGGFSVPGLTLVLLID